jgi:hypothetical protein
VIPEEYPPAPTELEKVEGWRLEVLIKAGYSVRIAERLARAPWHEVDLHQAVELVEQGCRPVVAALILL